MTSIPKEELAVFTALCDINVVIDVGARTDLDMYKLKPQYKYYLFEAHTPFYNEIKDSGLNVFNVALSDTNETLLYDTKTQSFFNPNGGEVTSYTTQTLDSFNIQADFLKIDAEGMDYKILLGATETLKHVKYVQFEYWNGVRKFVDLLKGFELYLMLEPTLREAIRIFNHHPKYINTLVKLDADVIELIDGVLIPKGYGGNILAIK